MEESEVFGEMELCKATHIGDEDNDFYDKRIISAMAVKYTELYKIR